MEVSNHAYAVILAGGGGTRLWPKSRQKKPKHLLSLLGKETILQLTYKRMRMIFPPERILIVTHQNHLEEAKHQLPEMKKDNWIVESQAKNTALAIAVAAAYVGHRDPEGVILNVHSDQLITNDEKFVKAAKNALVVAEQTENLVTIAIKPTFAHTGLGYIRVGEQFEDTPAFKARGFKEKPDFSTAQAFLASGQYLWNSGMYSWSVKNLNTAFAEHSPEFKKHIDVLLGVIGTEKEEETVKKIYSSATSEAIDYAVSEKAKNLVVIPGDFGWSDVGDWKVVYDLSKKDGWGNARVSEENTVLIETRNSLVEVGGRMIAVVGLSDIVIVDTPDALLVCHKDRTQDVKKVVEQLKEQKKTELL
jgi:mannose-1-phosphate guanylyltransferase